MVFIQFDRASNLASISSICSDPLVEKISSISTRAAKRMRKTAETENIQCLD
ncbi:hypothetical protein M7I_7659 [Glarea lozoyensis 74030]|uniref:Uncharacterized protein n=1 Tax=Glarea lozoyensis (strain ATCC 74030 / MF5533) TaxID=1104152 RepID=H0EXW7_GLAL7|nr:hypothetical protein M7I_7659 [Glarea lozoyensis 74030]